MLEIHNLSKQFGDSEVLKGVSLKVPKGEIFTIIGPSGAGKSTLLRLINLLDTPTEGTILLDGTDIHKEKNMAVRRRMGMVFQKPAIFNQSVYENVALGLRFRQIDERVIRKKVADALAIVGLTGFEERKAKTLSGGEMQRIALARVLVTDPDVLLLDEPTANLDPVSVRVIEELVQRIHHEFQTTIIMSTHDMFQGQRLAHRIGVMIDGKFAQFGTPREIFTTPNDRFVARFVGIENVIEGRIISKDRGIAFIQVGRITIQALSPLPVGTDVTIFFRPEDVAISCSSSHAESVRNVFPGQIVSITPMGPYNRIIVDCGVKIIAMITYMATEDLGLKEGSDVCVSFKATAPHILAAEE
ncbi:ABC transporter [Methanocalculus chunghsingensis]|uniref:Molybdate/tungstate import ATP-binding protein WtpC n=1 Tax=Methanocalculus chunghsingensis TaxID=156457 RepID=A0A8J8B5X6_9EURY|nr:ABC transporter ATP-binding protein [Methanocalculus chunghsingensis]MBR1368052.1 ABC transporter [Methanocalculus chunghsingensis]